MKLRPLTIGITFVAMLLAGCNNQGDGTDPNTMGGDITNDMSGAANDAQDAAGSAIDDGVITTKVKSALLADDTVKGLDINVDTAQGVVRLSGMVDSQAQVDMATQIARSVEGVQDVQSELTVNQ
jgi:hyperosmotically inducible protein